jgi:hypothetical protein
MSPLRQALVDYLAVRRALGFKLGRAEGLLLQFVNYAEERGEQHLLTSTMLAWATLPVNTTKNWLAKRLSIVRGFSSHLRTIDPATEVPPTDLLPWQRCRATPYLYSDDEVATLITLRCSSSSGACGNYPTSTRDPTKTIRASPREFSHRCRSRCVALSTGPNHLGRPTGSHAYRDGSTDGTSRIGTDWLANQ